MAGPLGKGRLLPCRYRRPQAQVLCSGGVPLSLRPGPARGPRPALHRHGRGGPEAPDGGLQRPLPHGLRRLRPAHRELRHQEPHPPRQGHPRQHRQLHQAAEDAGLFLRLGPRRGHHRPRLLQVDPVDLPPAVQEGPGLQDLHARELVHLLQVRAGQRGSGQRRLRALRLGASGC